MTTRRSLCRDEAENRKHSIRAILATLCPQSEPDEAKATAYRATHRQLHGQAGASTVCKTYRVEGVAASGVAPPQSARPRLQPPYALSAPNVQNGALLVAQKWTLYPRDDTEQGFLVQSVEGEHPCFLENYDKCPVLPISHTKHRGAWRRPSQKKCAQNLSPVPATLS